MLKGIKEIMREEHKGFQGLTHWLISVFIFFIMWLIPWSVSHDYISAISSSALFGVMVFFTVGGASLLPDLDSSPLQGGGSAAIYQLGFLGDLLSMMCITISGLVYSIAHTRYDDKPESQHRMLFHAPIIPIILYIYVNFFMPDSRQKLMGNFSLENSNVLIVIFLAAISIYLGANMLIYKLLGLVGMQRSTHTICFIIMVVSIIYMMNMPFNRLKLIGTSVSLGYLIHILSDVLTKGSAPLFFPIPTPTKSGKWRLWWKPYILGPRFTITTGGVLNIMINFSLMGLDILLFWIIFIK